MAIAVTSMTGDNIIIAAAEAIISNVLFKKAYSGEGE
jgi:hypothetical protein